MRVWKIKNIMIFYNIITILKYLILRSNILYIDFVIDFVFLNAFIFGALKIDNYISKGGNYEK